MNIIKYMLYLYENVIMKLAILYNEYALSRTRVKVNS